MSRKAEDAGGLTPAKDDNAARRKIDRKDNSIFRLVDYIIVPFIVCHCAIYCIMARSVL